MEELVFEREAEYWLTADLLDTTPPIFDLEPAWKSRKSRLLRERTSLP
jgi:hypothetical protein